MKAVILNISSKFLAEFLGLPEGAKIDGFYYRFDQPDIVRIRVQDAGWEVAEGMPIVNVVGTCIKENGKLIIDWGLPE